MEKSGTGFGIAILQNCQTEDGEVFILPTMQQDHIKFDQRSLTVSKHGQRESSQIVEPKKLDCGF